MLKKNDKVGQVIPRNQPHELFDRPLGMTNYHVQKLIEALSSYSRNGVYNIISHDKLVRIIRDSAKHG